MDRLAAQAQFGIGVEFAGQSISVGEIAE